MNGNILCLAKALPQESFLGLELLGRAQSPQCRHISQQMVCLCIGGISQDHCCDGTSD